jgi:hypothetical protein
LRKDLADDDRDDLGTDFAPQVGPSGLDGSGDGLIEFGLKFFIVELGENVS